MTQKQQHAGIDREAEKQAIPEAPAKICQCGQATEFSNGVCYDCRRARIEAEKGDSK